MWPQLLVTTVKAVPLGVQVFETSSCLLGNQFFSFEAHVSSCSWPEVTFWETGKTYSSWISFGLCLKIQDTNKIQPRGVNSHCLLHPRQTRLVKVELKQSDGVGWSGLFIFLHLRTHLCLANRLKILEEAQAVDNVICSLKCAPLLPHSSKKKVLPFHMEKQVSTDNLTSVCSCMKSVLPLRLVLDINQLS